MPAQKGYRLPLSYIIRFAVAVLTGRRREVGRDAAAVLARSGLRCRIDGAERIPTRGPFVLIANHYERPGLKVFWGGMLLTAAVWERRGQSPRWLMTSEWYNYRLGPVPVPVVIFVVVFAALWVVLNHTRFGRHVYAIGDNEEAARLMGLNVGRVTVGVYALSGALAGLAGVVLASRLGAGQPVAGVGAELDAIAAVVVGGTLLTGGQGGLGSTVVGVLLLGVILNVINMEGTITSWWQLVLRGVILLAVVILQNRLSQRK